MGRFISLIFLCRVEQWSECVFMDFPLTVVCLNQLLFNKEKTRLVATSLGVLNERNVNYNIILTFQSSRLLYQVVLYKH